MTRSRGALIIAAGVVLAFLIGFGWQFVRAQGLQRQLEETRRVLLLTEMETQLAAATVSAQQGSFDAAVQLMSDFFTSLQQHAAEAPAEVRQEFGDMLARRDAVIAGLSRASPESAETLLRMYVRYRVVVGGPERALPVGTA